MELFGFGFNLVLEPSVDIEISIFFDGIIFVWSRQSAINFQFGAFEHTDHVVDVLVAKSLFADIVSDNS